MVRPDTIGSYIIFIWLRILSDIKVAKLKCSGQILKKYFEMHKWKEESLEGQDQDGCLVNRSILED